MPDSNRHGFLQGILSPPRLPVSTIPQNGRGSWDRTSEMDESKSPALPLRHTPVVDSYVFTERLISTNIVSPIMRCYSKQRIFLFAGFRDSEDLHAWSLYILKEFLSQPCDPSTVRLHASVCPDPEKHFGDFCQAVLSVIYHFTDEIITQQHFYCFNVVAPILDKSEEMDLHHSGRLFTVVSTPGKAIRSQCCSCWASAALPAPTV